jgi:uncharacterized protein YdaU (DUF1376 family)
MARPDSKSPAFQFYPADYLSDINVVLMPNQARGCYITLMSHEWLAKGNGISNQISALAKICGESEEEMALLWQSLEICFIPHPKDDTKLIHPRLENSMRYCGTPYNATPVRKVEVARWKRTRCVAACGLSYERSYGAREREMLDDCQKCYTKVVGQDGYTRLIEDKSGRKCGW